DPHNFYFKITSLNLYDHNKEIARSTNYANRTFPYVTHTYLPSVNAISQFPAKSAKPPLVQTFENYRDTVDVLPSGEMIEVGCSITPELKELHRTALNLTVVGGLILLVGLVGGWWLVSRAIKPINE